jgi:hypothetical protein
MENIFGGELANFFFPNSIHPVHKISEEGIDIVA